MIVILEVSWMVIYPQNRYMWMPDLPGRLCRMTQHFVHKALKSVAAYMQLRASSARSCTS